MLTINSDRGQVKVDGHPNKCPFCHKTITPNFLTAHQGSGALEVLLVCPNQECNKSFLGYYKYLQAVGYWRFNGETTQGTLMGREFSETIEKLSESFVEIYNQSYAAEQQGLTEICGVGYRKAIEFLIKDYSISHHPDDKEKIEKKFLGACIEEYVTDARVKTVAKRATWLGNDETHYVRKWEGKNLEDLKKLIDLTIHWIEMESLTKSFEDEMPD